MSSADEMFAKYERTVTRNKAKLDALRTLNHLTRLVQDIDPFTVCRDLKNIEKSMETLQRHIAQVKHHYADDSESSEG